MKKIIIGSLLAVGLVSGLAYAHDNNHGMFRGPGGMMGYGMMGAGAYNCPGMSWSGQGEVDQEYLERTTELRKKMHNLRFEYMEAYRNPETTQQTLANLRQEMNNLHDQLFDNQKGLLSE